MKILATSVSVIAATAGGAIAGGLDRTGQPIQALFEPGGDTGNYAELGFSRTYVNLDGTGVGIDAAGFPAGTSYSNVGNDFNSFGGALKWQFTDQLSGAVIFEQPYGADVSYSGDPGASELGGTSALAETESATFYLRYKFDDRWGVHGGLRVQRVKGNITLSGLAYGLPEDQAASLGGQASAGAQQAAAGAQQAAAAAQQAAAAGDAATAAALGAQAQDLAAQAQTLAAQAQTAAGTANGYNVKLEEDYALGYAIGASYEIPEIAARVSLTYNSEISHDMKTRETGPSILGLGAVYDGTSTTEVKTPQSLNLEFRTGIAADTLLFGSIRWVDWSAFRIDPEYFMEATGSGLVDLEDTTTYALGLGRRFTDQLAGSFAVSYEAPGDDLVSPLAPTTGLWALQLGASYTVDNWVITGGMRHTWLGDAMAETGTPDTARADFADNTATTVGLRIGYNF